MFKVKKIVDLSIPLTKETPIFPGDPKPDIFPAATIEANGYSVHSLTISSHFGTHVDAPYHFNPNGEKIDESDLGLFMGKGVVITVTGKREQEAIGLSDVSSYLDKLEPGCIVLIHTGWSQYIGEEKYFRHPYVRAEVVEEMLKRGVRTFFIDALNIDPTGGTDYPCHDKITEVNGIIGENFTNFDAIDFPDPFILSFPLKIAGSDGSPVRAVAIDVDCHRL